MKQRFRQAAFFLFRWTGFLTFWRRLHRCDVTILMVHGTMEERNGVRWTPLRPQLPPRRLEECIRVLSRHYSFVSLTEAVEMIIGKRPMRPRCLALTFDDGYRNNVKYALPILRRQNVPATFFVASGHVEGRKPYWFDRLDYALQVARVDGREVRIGNATVRLKAGSREELLRSYKTLRDEAKAVLRPDAEMLAEMESIAAGLEMESGRKLKDIFETDDWSAVMDWGDIRRASGDDTLFQSHTVDHIRLGMADEGTVRDQLARSKAMIENSTGRTCRYLCYPNGSYTPRVMEIARACGYEAAVTIEEGPNRVGDDPMSLRRIHLPVNGGMSEVLSRVAGLSGVRALFRLPDRPDPEVNAGHGSGSRRR